MGYHRTMMFVALLEEEGMGWEVHATWCRRPIERRSRASLWHAHRLQAKNRTPSSLRIKSLEDKILRAKDAAPAQYTGTVGDRDESRKEGGEWIIYGE